MKKNIEVKRAIQSPFVFISYSYQYQENVDKVKKLAHYLKKKRVNVIFDEGGLSIGVNKKEFMDLILHKNCKIVLMICDSSYVKKITDFNSGVNYEYHNIKKREEEIKIVPLIAEENRDALVVPMEFVDVMYMKMLDDSDATFLKICDKIKECSKAILMPNIDYENEAKLYFNAASNYYDMGSYILSEENILQSIELFENVHKNKNRQLCECYNLLTAIYVMRDRAEDAEKSMKNAYEYFYRMNKKDSLLKLTCDFNMTRVYYHTNKIKCLEMAERLYKTVPGLLNIETNAKDLYEFCVLYANALYNAGYKSKAYEVESEALAVARKYALEEKENFYRLSDMVLIIAELVAENTYSPVETEKKFNDAWLFIQEASTIEQRKVIAPKDAIEFYNVVIKFFMAKKGYYEKQSNFK